MGLGSGIVLGHKLPRGFRLGCKLPAREPIRAQTFPRGNRSNPRGSKSNPRGLKSNPRGLIVGSIGTRAGFFSRARVLFTPARAIAVPWPSMSRRPHTDARWRGDSSATSSDVSRRAPPKHPPPKVRATPSRGRAGHRDGAGRFEENPRCARAGSLEFAGTRVGTRAGSILTRAGSIGNPRGKLAP